MPLLPKLPSKSNTERIHREILETESKVGAEIFGPIEKGRQRSFFCLNKYTWVWHEQWIENKTPKSLMTYYHIRHNGILKSSGNQDYKPLSQNELDNFIKAAEIYEKTVPEILSAKYL